MFFFASGGTVGMVLGTEKRGTVVSERRENRGLLGGG